MSSVMQQSDSKHTLMYSSWSSLEMFFIAYSKGFSKFFVFFTKNSRTSTTDSILALWKLIRKMAPAKKSAKTQEVSKKINQFIARFSAKSQKLAQSTQFLLRRRPQRPARSPSAWCWRRNASGSSGNQLVRKRSGLLSLFLTSGKVTFWKVLLMSE